jgi:hypothetical protein
MIYLSGLDPPLRIIGFAHIRTGISGNGHPQYQTKQQSSRCSAHAPGPCLFMARNLSSALPDRSVFCNDGRTCAWSGPGGAGCCGTPKRAACFGSMCQGTKCVGGTDYCCGEGTTYQATAQDCVKDAIGERDSKELLFSWSHVPNSFRTGKERSACSPTPLTTRSCPIVQ